MRTLRLADTEKMPHPNIRGTQITQFSLATSRIPTSLPAKVSERSGVSVEVNDSGRRSRRGLVGYRYV